MKGFRRNRSTVGGIVAALFLLVAAAPGLVAAAEGMRIQAPICSPDGTKPADHGGAPFVFDDHCQICPFGSFTPPALAAANDVPPPVPGRNAASSFAGDGIFAGDRAEMFPLKGRAPPLRS